MNKIEFSKLAKLEVRRAVAKARPETLFEQVFYDLRVKAKDLKNKWEKDSGGKLENTVMADLASQNINVLEHKLSLGKYRGSRFVTSFKLKIKVDSQKDAENLVAYLKNKYSPKWRLSKISEDGIAELNVRGTDMNKKKVARELICVAKLLNAAWWSKRDAEREVRKALDKAWEAADDWRRDAKTQESLEAEEIMEKVQEHIADAMEELKNVRDL